MYKAKCTITNEVVAIKHLRDFHKIDYSYVKILREIQILKGLQMPPKCGLGCSFAPELLDIIIPQDQADQENDL